MTTRKSRLFSDLAIPPGEILGEEIEARGMTQKELATKLNRPAQTINEIIKGKKAITADTAIELEKALGIEAHFWNQLEADYSRTLTRNRERDGIETNRKHPPPFISVQQGGCIETGNYTLENLQPTENRNCLNYPSFAPILRVTYALCLSTFGLMHIMGALPGPARILFDLIRSLRSYH